METLDVQDQLVEIFLKRVVFSNQQKNISSLESPVDFVGISVAPPTLLIVDDDSELCEEIENLFRKYRYKVLSVGTSKEAKRILTENAIDLVLLDLRLPDGNGLDLVKKIKKAREDVSIIVITGYGSFTTAINAIRERVYDYISKPFDPEKLIKIVNQAALDQIKERSQKKDMVIKDQFQKLAVGRELKMIKLKKEIEQLKKELSKKKQEAAKMDNDNKE